MHGTRVIGASSITPQFQSAPAIGDAESFTDWRRGVLKILTRGNELQIFGDLFRMRKYIVCNHQDFRRKLRQKKFYLLWETAPVGIQKHQIEGAAEFAGDSGRVSCSQLHPIEKTRAPQIFPRQRMLIRIA